MSQPDPAAARALGGRQAQLKKLVEWLADPMIWNWMQMSDDRRAADHVLAKMAKLGLIGYKEHKWGGAIWTVGRSRYGRTED